MRIYKFIHSFIPWGGNDTDFLLLFNCCCSVWQMKCKMDETIESIAVHVFIFGDFTKIFRLIIIKTKNRSNIFYSIEGVVLSFQCTICKYEKSIVFLGKQKPFKISQYVVETFKIIIKKIAQIFLI